MKMKTRQTIGEAMRQRINEDLDNKAAQLDKSILGSITSAHLEYQKYNLDQHYIMHQKVQEYKAGCEKPYSQFVTGMIPDRVLKNLGKYDILRIEQTIKQHADAREQDRSDDQRNGDIPAKTEEQTAESQITAERVLPHTSKVPSNAADSFDDDAEERVEPPPNSFKEVFKQKTTARQEQQRKWEQMHNNALDYLISMRKDSSARAAFKDSLDCHSFSVIE